MHDPNDDDWFHWQNFIDTIFWLIDCKFINSYFLPLCVCIIFHILFLSSSLSSSSSLWRCWGLCCPLSSLPALPSDCLWDCRHPCAHCSSPVLLLCGALAADNIRALDDTSCQDCPWCHHHQDQDEHDWKWASKMMLTVVMRYASCRHAALNNWIRMSTTTINCRVIHAEPSLSTTDWHMWCSHCHGWWMSRQPVDWLVAMNHFLPCGCHLIHWHCSLYETIWISVISINQWQSTAHILNKYIQPTVRGDMQPFLLMCTMPSGVPEHKGRYQSFVQR